MRNVVLLTIDAFRRDALGLYSGTDNLTPFLDSLEDDALVFDGAHAVGPYTQASFPGILTSSYLFDEPPSSKRLSPKRALISEALNAKGVTTAAFHSSPYLSAYFGWNRGWDTFYDSMQDEVDDYSPYIKGYHLNQKVKSWFQSRNKRVATSRDTDETATVRSSDRAHAADAFFLWVHYMDMHEPYVPDRRYLARVGDSVHLSSDQMLELFREVLLRRDVSDMRTVNVLRNLYKAHACEVDDYAQDLFEILDSCGALSDTTVIITADHGEEFGEHGGLSHDGKMFSELVHVPLLVFNPPEARGRRCDRLVSGLDISPTIMALLGHDPDARFQGQSLFPLDNYQDVGVYGEALRKLTHKVKATDKPAYYYREENLKVIYSEEADQWELYNLERDGAEKDNIIDSSPESSRLKQKLGPRIRREPIFK